MKVRLLVMIAAAIALQVVVLTGMVAVAAMPLITGTEINVRTRPVDPRDMFRGNYARLAYDFSQVPNVRNPLQPPLRIGEVIFVSLRQADDGLYEFDSVALERPDSGVFLRGRVQYTMGEQLDVLYGIEALFAPREEALALEQQLRNRAVATLAVSSGGRARIVGVVSAN